MATSNTPNQVRPPALPLAPNTYNRAFQDQLNNVLRLFFNNIDGNLNTILSPNSGGTAIYQPYGFFYSTATQTAALADTDQAVEFQEQFETQGVTLTGVDSTDITVTYSGVYNFQVTLQVFSTNSTAKDITVHIDRNGVNIPYSSQRKTVAKTGFDQVVYSFNLTCATDDVITILFRVSATTLRLESTAPTAGLPGVPSATVVTTFLSNVGL